MDSRKRMGKDKDGVIKGCTECKFQYDLSLLEYW